MPHCVYVIKLVKTKNVEGKMPLTTKKNDFSTSCSFLFFICTIKTIHFCRKLKNLLKEHHFHTGKKNNCTPKFLNFLYCRNSMIQFQN